MNVAVAGATGGVGKAIVERLAREGVPTRALVRDPYAAVSCPLLCAVCIINHVLQHCQLLPAQH